MSRSLKIFLAIGVLSIFSVQVRSQEITGTVLDSRTKEPIFGASVYYDGSSVGTMTDENGNFEIGLPYRNNAVLVISHLGYQAKEMVNLPDDAVLRVLLQEQMEDLQEVVLTSDPFSRREKLEVFRLEFLGDTRGGRSSIIENEKEIRLYFNSEDNTLSAYCDKPIVIQNNYLGYRIYFNIDEFKIFFKRKSLERVDNIHQTIFDGSTHFFDTSQGNPKIADRREKTYLGSPRHFMRACWYGDMDSQNFKLKKNYKDVVLTDFMVNMAKPNEDLRDIRFMGSQYVIYYRQNGNYRSTLKINELDTTYILDRYGNYSPFENLAFGGHMSDYRLGDMLPMDYGL